MSNSNNMPTISAFKEENLYASNVAILGGLLVLSVGILFCISRTLDFATLNVPGILGLSKTTTLFLVVSVPVISGLVIIIGGVCIRKFDVEIGKLLTLLGTIIGFCVFVIIAISVFKNKIVDIASVCLFIVWTGLLLGISSIMISKPMPKHIPVRPVPVIPPPLPTSVSVGPPTPKLPEIFTPISLSELKAKITAPKMEEKVEEEEILVEEKLGVPAEEIAEKEEVAKEEKEEVVIVVKEEPIEIKEEAEEKEKEEKKVERRKQKRRRKRSPTSSKR